MDNDASSPHERLTNLCFCVPLDTSWDVFRSLSHKRQRFADALRLSDTVCTTITRLSDDALSAIIADLEPQTTLMTPEQAACFVCDELEAQAS